MLDDLCGFYEFIWIIDIVVIDIEVFVCIWVCVIKYFIISR